MRREMLLLFPEACSYDGAGRFHDILSGVVNRIRIPLRGLHFGTPEVSTPSEQSIDWYAYIFHDF